MANTTGIEWTDATWNPIRGCSRVSEGCRNCYAEKVAYRFSGPGQPYEGLVQLDSAISRENARRIPKWNGKIKFVEEHLLDPLKWKKPRRIFVNSMSDLFHENVTDEMLDRIFAVMALCPQHTFQVLTKRPERMLKYLGRACGRIADVVMKMRKERNDRSCVGPLPHITPGAAWWPLANVWLGVSVENQKASG
jgi:protein gp37